MEKINKEWHLANKMAKNAAFDQRVEWHREHLKHCACRTDLPPDIRKAIEAESPDPSS
jgi:hypothetical protein